MASKRRPKVIVCAGRRPPHPWGETGESVLVGRYLGNGGNGEPAKKQPKMASKSIKNQWKWGPKSMGNRWKVEVASQMRFWCVPGAKTHKTHHSIWIPLDDHFRPKIQKNEKKNEYGHRALSRSAPRTQKKRFLRGSENVLFFWMFFSLKMAYFWRQFSMKKPYKNPCWFWTRKSHDFWWKINAKTVWMLALIFLFVCFRKVPNAK